ncbi:MAG: hypothetical protein HQM12_02665 [SAR324 cluster bacterium]|nr:hypothetical protein [SAR324 cluster bacterium]
MDFRKYLCGATIDYPYGMKQTITLYLFRCLLFFLLLQQAPAVCVSQTIFPVSPVSEISPYLQNPILTTASRITTTTSTSAETLFPDATSWIQSIQEQYPVDLPTQPMESLYKFTAVYDWVSQKHYQRGVMRYEGQRELADLLYYMTQSRWWHESLKRLTEDPGYSYSESRFLRTIIASHTSAHFYQIPYPLFFCLLFQESKFNFKIVSATGALGIGQLTGIGIKQIEIIRQDSENERLLQAAAMHLRNIYRDVWFQQILNMMELNFEAPRLGYFPPTIQKPYLNYADLSAEIMRKYGLAHPELLEDPDLVRKSLERIARGDILPTKYAFLHQIFNDLLEHRYNQQYGNVINIETNILISAMLLRYYLNYEWRVQKEKVMPQPGVQAILAIAAYNQGQTSVIRLLSRLKREFPDMDLNQATLQEISPNLTFKRMRSALDGPYSQTQELYRHVWEIKHCAHDLAKIGVTP